MRIYTDKIIEEEIVKGDTCGFGLNIFNSETGFHALEVTHYILRYICLNGAVIALRNGKKDRTIHYGHRQGFMQRFLSEQIMKSEVEVKGIIEKIQLSRETPSTDYIKYIRTRLGAIDKQAVSNILPQNVYYENLYDLFNAITNEAKYYDLEKRFYLEKLAGDLLYIKIQSNHNELLTNK